MKGIDLWKLRKEAGLTQRQLAKLIGKNSTWICRREQNNDHPDWMPITRAEEWLIRIAINYKVAMEEDDTTPFDKPSEVVSLREEIDDLLDSIANHCIQCMGSSVKEIRHCQELGCHFWPHRPFQKND